MLKINYKGYTISQANNNHIMICKDKQILFHAQCNRKLNEEELKQELEVYLKITKDKTKLVKVDNISYLDVADDYEKEVHSLWNDCKGVLGIYKTKERAIEILDEIQSLLQLKIEYKPIVQEEYNPLYTYKHFVKVDGNMEIEELSTFVYNMPKE